MAMNMDALVRIKADVQGANAIQAFSRDLKGLDSAAKISSAELGRMNIAINKMAREAGNTTAGIRQHISALQNLRDRVDINGKAYNRLGAEISQLQGKLRSLDSEAKQSSGGFGALRGTLGSLLGAFAAFQGVKFIFSSASELESQVRSLQVLTGSAEQAKNIVAQLQDLGAVTPFTSTELIDSAKRLQAFGVEAGKVVDTTRRLADVSGATGAELDGLVTAYGQVQAKGRLQGEELLQFQERGVALQKVLRDEYGLSSQEFQKALEQGKISAEAVEYALIKLTDVGGKYANGAIAQSDTLRGKLSTLQDSFQRLAQNIGRFFEPVFKFLIDGINGFLERVNNSTRIQAEAQASSQASIAARNKFGLRSANPFDREVKDYQEAQRKLFLQQALKRSNSSSISAPAPAKPLSLPPLLTGSSSGSGASSSSSSSGASRTRNVAELLNLSNAELTAAINTAIGEYGGPDPRGRTDVFANILARSRSGIYPRNLVDVVTQSGQYAPNFGRSRQQVTSPSLYSKSLFEQVKNELLNPSLLQQSIKDVDSRLYFKGISQYGNMIKGVDFLRAPGQNFFHGPGKSNPGRNPQITAQLLQQLSGAQGVASYFDEQQQTLTASIEAGDKIIQQMNEQNDLLILRSEYEKELQKLLWSQQERESEIGKLLDANQRTKAKALSDELKSLELIKLQNTSFYKKAGLDQREYGAGGASGAFMTNIDVLGQQDSLLNDILNKYPLIGQAAAAAGELVTQGTMSMIDGTKSAKQVFSDFLKSIADMLLKTAAQMISQYIALGIARMFAGGGAATGGLGAAGSAFGAAAFGSSSGSALSSIGLGSLFQPAGPSFTGFAKGGIVNKPTIFRYASGGAFQTGLMGEAGPEAIIPLRRGRDGKLGIAGGGGETSVVVNVDAKGTNVQGDNGKGEGLGRVLAAAVQQELIRQRRPGGLLAA